MAIERDQNIIELCLSCKEMCSEWLKENNIKSPAQASDDCEKLMLECFDICSYTITALQRETPFAKEICQLCELICEACGNECSQSESPETQKCADICYEVAESCRIRLF
ncbi:four-helix bundle copper-binding protein [Pseudalkalibacillus sp. A8]|uniref:four-helix bundle copper-binding protein n=1 Tax=Pseudalkalibacillus sp. A8 TaxID=3382641 RepID=UPI0038B453A3